MPNIGLSATSMPLPEATSPAGEPNLRIGRDLSGSGFSSMIAVSANTRGASSNVVATVASGRFGASPQSSSFVEASKDAVSFPLGFGSGVIFI